MFFDITDEQAIIINFVTGIYYGTTSLGSIVLEYLLSGVSEKNILTELKKNNDIPENFEKDFTNFINECVQKEILISTDGENKECEEFPKSAFSDGYKLQLNEFAEVQEMLLADPVHDVEIEEGWPVLKDDQK